MKNELILEKEKFEQIQLNLKETDDNLNNKIKEGNDVEIQFEEIKNKRNLLIEQLFGNSDNSDDINNKIIDENDE